MARRRKLAIRCVAAVGVAGFLVGPIRAHAQDPVPPLPLRAPSLSEMATAPRIEADAGGYRVLVISTGAVVGVIGANFMTGGMLTALLAVGTGTAMPTATAAGPTLTLSAVATFVATEAAWAASDALVAAAAPTAALSVGAPVDAALRDGYTTPATLAMAIGESVSRAGTVAVDIGTYAGETAISWLGGS